MMTPTLDTPRSKKPHEPLNKLFNVLFTETQHLKLNDYACRFGVSKGRLIREALEESFRKIDAENNLE
ncbi:MAG: hypothetical protein SGJ16_10315 [Nitrospirota bacterium]|nr:hypothetical protein [Nitrospirota bacterium]